MASTELQLILRVRGAALQPSVLTRQTGIVPTRSFEVGEARGRSAETAGWDLESPTGADDEPLLADLVARLQPHRDVLRAWRQQGCTITLTVVGEVRGDLVQEPEEADRRGYLVENDRPFEPFFDVDRVGVGLNESAVAFLAEVGAAYYTHIDCEYERPR
jgi:hypothetical protein